MISQLSVFIENRAGTLADITEIFAKNKIDIRALFIAETANYGVLRLIVDDSENAEKILKAQGIPVEVNSVVAVSVLDEVGGLSKLLRLLADNDIDVSYMYSVFGKGDKKAHMIIRVENEENLNNLLNEKGIETDSLEDIK